MKQITTFYVGDTFCGVDILQAKEINDHMNYTAVPDSKDYIKGLLNLRGQIITIFDLAKRLGRDATVIEEKTRNLILKTDSEAAELFAQGLLQDKIGNDAVGFVIDKVGDVVEVDEEDIQPAPANIGDIAKEFISGVIELDEKLLILLNLTELVGN